MKISKTNKDKKLKEQNINIASNDNHALKTAIELKNEKMINMLLNNKDVIKGINKKWIKNNINPDYKSEFIKLVKNKIKKNLIKKYKKKN
jgi:hypothetical protein